MTRCSCHGITHCQNHGKGITWFILQGCALREGVMHLFFCKAVAYIEMRPKITLLSLDETSFCLNFTETESMAPSVRRLK